MLVIALKKFLLESMTPFEFPLVPEVYEIVKTVSN